MTDTLEVASRYAIVGTGARHAMFSRALSETYAGATELVGLCDCNPAQLAEAARGGPRAERQRHRHLRGR